MTDIHQQTAAILNEDVERLYLYNQVIELLKELTDWKKNLGICDCFRTAFFDFHGFQLDKNFNILELPEISQNISNYFNDIDIRSIRNKPQYWWIPNNHYLQIRIQFIEECYFMVVKKMCIEHNHRNYKKRIL